MCHKGFKNDPPGCASVGLGSGRGLAARFRLGTRVHGFEAVGVGCSHFTEVYLEGFWMQVQITCTASQMHTYPHKKGANDVSQEHRVTDVSMTPVKFLRPLKIDSKIIKHKSDPASGTLTVRTDCQ